MVTNNPENHTPPAKQALSYEQLLSAEPRAAQELFNNLSGEEQLSLVLSAPWEKRQRLILLAQHADELIQALPEEELYWTVKETGIADALPLITRASFDQWQYILDIDCWQKDQIDMDQVVTWLQVMLRCHETKVRQWLANTDEQFLYFIFKKLFTITKLREDMDPVEVADQLSSWTLDGLYYFRFADEEARLVSIPFLHLLYTTDSTFFYHLMENTLWSFAAELEEELFRLRQSRVAEKGFPDLDEAVQVYQYVSAEHLQRLRSTAATDHRGADARQPTPQMLRHVLAMDQSPLFVQQVLSRLNSRPDSERIQRELVHVANQVIVADGLEVRDIQSLKTALRKVLGYANIGLELLSEQDASAAEQMLRTLPIRLLFRAGYSQALDLQRRLQRLHVTLWRHHQAARRHFFDGTWGATIEGLSQIRPTYFAGNSTPDSFLFREFETLADIHTTQRVLDIVAAAEKLFFEAMGITIDHLRNLQGQDMLVAEPFPVQARPLFLTILARQVLSGETAFVPLTAGELHRFLTAVFVRNEAGAGPLWVLNPAFRRETQQWARTLLNPSGPEQAALETFVECCLGLLQEQCGGVVENESIDPRFITAVMCNPHG